MTVSGVDRFGLRWGASRISMHRLRDHCVSRVPGGEFGELNPAQ